MKIFLIRHGQTTGDIEDRYGGSYDDHLSDLGLERSKELVAKLRGKDIEIIFSSPLIRAKETAHILSGGLNCAVEIVEDFKERNNYGILTGAVKAEAMDKYPDLVAKLGHYVHDVPESESYKDLKKRILSRFNELTSGNYNTIAILTHGGPISCIFREILGHDSIKIENCGFVEFLKKDESYAVLNLNGVTIG